MMGAMTVGAILLTIAMQCMSQSAMYANALHEKVEGMALYRYVRQALVHDIQFYDKGVMIDEERQSITTKVQDKTITMLCHGGRFFRELSDGQKQPYTGRINNWSRRMYWASYQGGHFVKPEKESWRYKWDGYAYKGKEQERTIVIKGAIVPYKQYYQMRELHE